MEAAVWSAPLREPQDTHPLDNLALARRLHQFAPLPVSRSKLVLTHLRHLAPATDLICQSAGVSPRNNLVPTNLPQRCCVSTKSPVPIHVRHCEPLEQPGPHKLASLRAPRNTWPPATWAHVSRWGRPLRPWQHSQSFPPPHAGLRGLSVPLGAIDCKRSQGHANKKPNICKNT